MNPSVRWRALVDEPSPRCLERVELAGLAGLSLLYRAGMAVDRGWHRVRGAWRPPVPSVCVGNVTIGGTGKTTLVRHLARRVHERGLTPGVVLRGYGRRDRRTTCVVHDGTSVRGNLDTAGDEALMLAEGLSGAVVVVGPSRRLSGDLATRRLGAQALVFDDGLQHWALSAHRTVALWDGTVDPSRARLFPRGLLRESLGALRRFDSVIVTRCDAVADPERIARLLTEARGGGPVLLARHEPVALRDWRGDRYAPDDLTGQRVLAFSSLGNPRALRATLVSLGASVVEDRVFPDHHRYSREEILGIQRAAEMLRADAVVTTEKDWVKLVGMDTSGIHVLEVDFALVGVEPASSPVESLVDFLCGDEVSPSE